MQREYFSIQYMVERLSERVKNNERTVLLLGARAGALFRCDALYETLKLFGDPSFATLSRTRQFSVCYALLTRQEMSIFTPNEVDTLLTGLLKDISYTEIDIMLATLIKLNVFQVVITTNIEDVLEQALEYVGMREQYDFFVYNYVKGDKEDNLRYDIKKTLIFKTFGQLSSGNYILKRSDFLTRHKEIESHLVQALRKDVLALGLDPGWDAEIYQAIHPTGGALWYVNDDPVERNAPFYQVAKTRNMRSLVNKEGSYEDFIRSLYWHYIERMSPNLVLHEVLFRELRQLRDEMRKLHAEIRALKDHSER